MSRWRCAQGARISEEENRAIRPPIFTEAGGNGKGHADPCPRTGLLNARCGATSIGARDRDPASILGETNAKHAHTCPAHHPW
jgi:hypothetical protein